MISPTVSTIASLPECAAVYVIHNPRGYKIGATKCLRKRYNAERQVECLVCFIGVDNGFEARALEEALHRKFSRCRIGSELFDLRGADIWWLKELAKSKNPLADCSASIPSMAAAIYKCVNCNHEWRGRRADPKECPRCKSRNWNRESRSFAEYVCSKCQHVWTGRVARVPKECPSCKSRNWQ